MKRYSIAFTAPGRVELESCELTEPELKRDEVFLETECTLVSPGTERACLLGLTDGEFPKYLGYSAVARVLRAGEEAGFQAGERVLVYHSIHSTHLVKQARDLVRIENDTLPAHAAVFAVIASMGLQGVRKARPEFGESLAVMGLGLLGLFAVRCAYLDGLFPVIAIVFLLRSFLFEPFRIPSGSMLPTLYIGDFILVNKYDYGLRLPVANTKVLEIGAPKRGDVIVFRYPVDTSIDYIKRVVGVPGDTVEYRNKVLYVNGVEQKLAAPRDFIDENTMVTLTEYDETLGDVTHLVAFDHRRPSWVPEGAISKKEPSCTYNDAGFICKVPEGHYFAMGDNRDNSEDSRYWGFVPDENLVGRAVLIWANFGDMSRVGGFR